MKLFKKNANFIDTEDKLFDAIIKVLKSGISKNEVENKIFTLWVTDNLLFNIVKKQAFMDDLKRKLADEKGYVTEWNAVKTEQPPQNHTFTPVADCVFLQIEEKGEAKPAAQKAKITAVQGRGSLLQESYLLNAEKQQRYNIGVGALPVTNNNRKNHIAIDDRIDSPQYSNNRYVSRAHACIVFSEKHGFCLQVEQGGCRLYGNRTRIFRDEETIEADNLQIPVPLHNGDLIELGKAVALRFETV